MRRCYTCRYWYTTQAWKGNCRKHPYARDRYNQDAATGDCPDYEDKMKEYAVAGKRETK